MSCYGLGDRVVCANELALWVHVLNKGNGFFGCEVRPEGFECRGYYPAHLEEEP